MRRIVLIGFVALTMVLTTFRAEAWYIMTPLSGQTYQQNSSIFGAGMTMMPTSAGTFAFLRRTVNAPGIIVPVVEDSVGVIAASVPGMPPYAPKVWAGTITAPGGGWTQSPPVPNMPPMLVPDHDTAVKDALLPLLPFVSGSITGPHTVN